MLVKRISPSVYRMSFDAGARIITNTGSYPRKSLGQHFLINPEVLQRIVSEAGLAPGDWVLEIGAGTGNLTRCIAGVAERWWALEKDKELCIRLTGEYMASIIESDARFFDYRSLDIPPGKKLKLLANLPYNVANEILIGLIPYRDLFSVMVCMVQEEVADRITACCGTKSYGVLSITMQLFFQVEKLFSVPAEDFFPPPKITSAVVRFQEREESSWDIPDQDFFFQLVKAAFSQRRKTLANALAGFSGHSRQELTHFFHESGINPSRRGETLSIEEYARLSRCFV